MRSNMVFGKNILPYQDEILKALARMVAIPSVCGPSEEGKPFGGESARALNEILKIASELGFTTKNVGNYAGHAEYGTGDEYAAVVAHVDVVPAGSGWETDPFCLTRKENLFFGRGTSDDKGPAVAALYGLKALKDAGVTGKRKLRVIFGAGEEIASGDLAMYFKSEPLPVMAFTPDSSYGICNREKGILRVGFRRKRGPGEIVRSFSAGTVVNAVPAEAEALVAGDFLERLKKAARRTDGDFRFEAADDGVKVISIGKAHHGAEPQLGFNAASHLVRLLGQALSEEELGPFLGFLNRAIGTETDGTSLGVKMSDEPSGTLTLNLGIVRLNASAASASIDIRYPVTKNGRDIFNTIRGRAEKAGVSAEMADHNAPLYFPEDHPLVHLLSDAYQAVEGVPAELYATGGGTYARDIPGRAVAFGADFPGQPDNHIHNGNEFLDLGRFMEHAQICLEAMYRLMTA